MKIFPQKRYEKYVEELSIPMAIINGDLNEHFRILIDEKGLKDSWKIGYLESFGDYCVGKHIALSGEETTTGYFFYEYFGICLQISASKATGASVQSIELLGSDILNEVHSQVTNEKTKPSSLSEKIRFRRDAEEKNSVRNLKIRPPGVDRQVKEERGMINWKKFVTSMLFLLGLIFFGLLRLQKIKKQTG